MSEPKWYFYQIASLVDYRDSEDLMRRAHEDALENADASAFENDFNLFSEKFFEYWYSSFEYMCDVYGVDAPDFDEEAANERRNSTWPSL